MSTSRIVSRKEWLAARQALLLKDEASPQGSAA